MAKKRANGEGNIRKRKDGRWEGRYTAGYDAKAGTCKSSIRSYWRTAEFMLAKVRTRA